MEKSKPYLTFSHPSPGPTAFLFKKAAELNARHMRELTVEERREATDRLADVRLIAPGTRFQAADCAGVPCEWVYRDDSPAGQAILYLHGGSWSFGNLKTARAVGVMLCFATGCRVLMAEYRLVPEHPFPAGLDDCAAAYGWLCENGFGGGRTAIFGDSAGGNLALALTHRLIAEGAPLPAALGLASPAPDMTARSVFVKATPDLLYTQHEGREQNLLSLYCGDHPRENPLISPVCGDLTGFPPMLIHVGQDEELCIDCDVFARKAHNVGVDVSLKIWRGMYHDFTIVGVTLAESRQSIREFGEFFRRYLLL